MGGGAGRLDVGQSLEGRAECRLEDICFAHCPDLLGLVGASHFGTPGMQRLSWSETSEASKACVFGEVDWKSAGQI